MASNFEFLHDVKKMQVIAKAAEDAEQAFQISSGACCLLSRRAAEYALHWMLCNDGELQNSFSDETDVASDKAEMMQMLRSFAFRDRIGEIALNYLHSIRISGNYAVHNYSKQLEKKDAEKSLSYLHFFLSCLNRQYNINYTNPSPRFDRSLLYYEQSSKKYATISNSVQSLGRKNEMLDFYQYETFSDALGLLTYSEQESVEKAVRQMIRTRKLNPGSINVADAEDENIFMLPIDKFFKLCIIIYWQAKVCTFLYAAEREKAVQWGKTIKCEVNVTTNELQVYTAAMPGSKGITPETDHVQENLDELRKNAGKFIFRDYDSEDLLALGVPEEYIPTIYDVTAETWPLMKGCLPGQAFDCLSLVLNGIPIKRVVKETYAGNVEVHSDEIQIAANNPQTGLVKIENEEEVVKMLEAPLEKWRVFLHPQQRRLAYHHYAGAARVLGGAGTGKSVVAIHHAKFLASDSASDYSILFTTFTIGLTGDLKNRLKSICSDEEYSKISVINLDALISDLLKSIHGKYNRIQYEDKVLNNAWEKAIEQSNVDISKEYSVGFLRDEWVNVIQAQDISRMEKYLSADRQGRGKRIDRKTREKLWVIFKNYTRIMAEGGWLDGDTAANYCSHQIQANPTLRHYDSIIVDESPDFGPAQFRLLRALCGEPHADDLYITGDPRQQIYTNKPKLILSRCNVNVRGRSTQLILNYRTTGNILKWANRLLRDIEYDDMDGGIADMGTTVSTVEGEKPDIQRFRNCGQEFNYVKGRIKELICKGINPGEIAVIARTNKALTEFMDSLKGSGIPAAILGKDGIKAKAVQLLTMHKSKGLEFSYVFVIEVNKDEVPNKVSIDCALDEIERERRINQEKQLLHVALTRSRRKVCLTCGGEPSEFLQLFATV